jgi:WD40 repeat protein
LWNLETAECVHVFEGHTSAVTCVRFTDDGRGLLTASADGTIKWWNLADGALRSTFSGHAGSVTAICPGIPGQSFFSASQDRTLREWELNTGRCLRVEGDYKAPLLCLAISDTRRYVLAGTSDGFIELYDVGASQRLGRRHAHSEPVTSVAMGRRGELAMTAVRGGKMRLWQLTLNRCLHTFRGAAPISISGDGEFALSAGSGNELHLWHAGFGGDILLAPMMLSQSYNPADDDTESTPENAENSEDEDGVEGA